MSYFKIEDSSLPNIILDRNTYKQKYPRVNRGTEGVVYMYDSKTAIKILDNTNISRKENKFNKVEIFAKITDPSFCFPKGLVGFEDKTKEGYFMDYVIPATLYSSFKELEYCYDYDMLRFYLVKASNAIERIHKKDIYIGDMRGGNILIDFLANPRFVDTDNYKYGDYDYDLITAMNNLADITYGKEFSDRDKNIFTYTIMALKLIYKYELSVLDKNDLNDFIACLNLSKEIKNALLLILSDADNKPYIGPILEDMDLSGDLFVKTPVFNRIKY